MKSIHSIRALPSPTPTHLPTHPSLTVCCVDIQNIDNEVNVNDPSVAQHNPLSGPIRRNSNASSFSWCTCSVSICRDQLNGRVAWVGQPNDQVCRARLA